MAPADHPPYLGIGFASQGVEVGLPLSPDAYLVMNHEANDGAVEVVDLDRLPFHRYLRPSWAATVNATGLSSASRYLFGRSQADLEFTRISLPEDLRRRSPKVSVSSMPPEWRYLMPDAFDLDDQEELGQAG